MSTCTELVGFGSEELLRLCAELDRLHSARNHAIAAYIAQVHAQRGLTGEELQRALNRTADAQEAFERINALVYTKEKEFAAQKQALLANDPA